MDSSVIIKYFLSLITVIATLIFFSNISNANDLNYRFSSSTTNCSLKYENCFEKFYYSDDAYYVGETKAGVRDGIGLIEDLEELYIGEWKNNQRNGVGIVVSKDKKHRCAGLFADNKNEFGFFECMAFPNPITRNVGEISAKGFGKHLIFSKDNTVKFEKNLKGFFGKEIKIGDSDKIFIFRSTLENCFKDFKNCIGEQEYDNDVIYKGEFLNDLPNGIGLAIWPQDVRNFRRVYFGEWKDGCQNGIGFWSEIDENSTKNEWNYVDGSTYTGYWKDCNQEGFGISTIGDSKIYCERIKGKCNGKRLYLFADGEVEISDFVNGKNINQQKEEKNSIENKQEICTKGTLNMCWIALTNNSGYLPPEECYECFFKYECWRNNKTWDEFNQCKLENDSLR